MFCLVIFKTLFKYIVSLCFVLKKYTFAHYNFSRKFSFESFFCEIILSCHGFSCKADIFNYLISFLQNENSFINAETEMPKILHSHCDWK